MKKLALFLVCVFMMTLLASWSCDNTKKDTDEKTGIGDIVVGPPGDGGDGDDGGEGDETGDGTDPGDDRGGDQPGDGEDDPDEDFSYTLWPEGAELYSWDEGRFHTAIEVLFMLKNKDWGALGAMTHPKEGLIFSPYGYVNEDTAVCLGAGDVKALGLDKEVRNWGIFEGSGDPINYTFDEYYDRFIFSHDFTKNPQIAVGQIVRTTMEDNLWIFGNGGGYFDFHIPGSGVEEDFNWASLRLVYNYWENELYFQAIVHDEWTP